MARSLSRLAFDRQFSLENLRGIFDDKISNTRAIGRDGTRSDRFAEQFDGQSAIILRKVRDCTYEFTRYKDRLVSKGVGKIPRLLSIPTVRDRLVLRTLCEFLADMFPEAAARKPHHYVRAIRDLANNAEDGLVFLKVDIQDYYGSISRNLLLKVLRRRFRIKEAIHLIEKAISTPTMRIGLPEPGIPQGLSISNVLASIYLMDVDAQMLKKWTYFRYVDDILLLVESSKVEEAFAELNAMLKKKKLKCHPLGAAGSKTYVASVDTGIEYLGFHIRKGLISIRESSYKKMFFVLNKVLTNAKYRRVSPSFFWKLNLKITGCRFNGKQFGWVSFFRQSEDVKQFARMDGFLSSQMRKLGLSGRSQEVKSFLRSYYEIRFELQDTNYIPNFDVLSIEDKRQHLVRLGVQRVDSMSDEEVELTFSRRVGRAVGELEEDLFEAFS